MTEIGNDRPGVIGYQHIHLYACYLGRDFSPEAEVHCLGAATCPSLAMCSFHSNNIATEKACRKLDITTKDSKADLAEGDVVITTFRISDDPTCDAPAWILKHLDGRIHPALSIDLKDLTCDNEKEAFVLLQDVAKPNK